MKMLSAESHLYDQSYFDGRIDSRRAMAYQLDAYGIHKRAPFALSVLDIGGGFGEFGRYLDCPSYFCYDPHTLKNEIPDRAFEVVTFRGSLQHIYNPVEMLQTAKDHLEPAGGLLAILATPDTDSLGYIRWGTLPALDPVRNWIPFGHRMLANVLHRLGFSRIEFEWPYGKPYARPLRNLWSFVIGKPDAFPGNMMNCYAVKE